MIFDKSSYFFCCGYHFLFLGVTFDRTLYSSKHASSLKAKLFPCLKASRCISASSWSPSKESFSLLYLAFLRSLLTYTSPEWFPFLSVTNLTKLKRLYRAAIRAISSCLLSSLISLLLSEASLTPLRVTLTHFAPSFYEQALRLPTSFSILGLARLGVKSRLSRSSWRAFASTYPLMLSPTSPREVLFCLSSLSSMVLAFRHGEGDSLLSTLPLRFPFLSHQDAYCLI